MEIRVVNFRRGPFKNVAAFFDVVLDNALVVRGNALKQRNDGKYYYQTKGIARIGKDKQPALNDEGFAIYDNVVDLYTEKSGEEWKPTQAAWDIRDQILAAALEILQSDPAQENAGRGSAQSKGKAKVAAGSKANTAKSVEGIEDEDNDNDLPF